MFLTLDIRALMDIKIGDSDFIFDTTPRIAWR